MLKIKVEHARVNVTASYRVRGSVLRGDIQAEMTGVETRLSLDSPEPPERISKLVKMAERGCFIMSALQNPVPVTSTVALNGEALHKGGEEAQ